MSKMHLDKDITHIKTIPPPCRILLYYQKNTFSPLKSISGKMKLGELLKKAQFSIFESADGYIAS